MAEEGGKLVINVQKMATMNIQFKDGDEVIAGGDTQSQPCAELHCFAGIRT